jgi:hypothetical protein
MYTACMLKSSGTIRLIDPSLPSSSLLGHRTAFETQVQWSRQGPQGTPGVQGPPGPPGTSAAENLYTSPADGNVVLADKGLHRVVYLTLPAGSYELTAGLTASWLNSPAGGFCEFSGPGDAQFHPSLQTDFGSSIEPISGVGDGQDGSIAMTGAVTTGGDIGVDCEATQHDVGIRPRLAFAPNVIELHAVLSFKSLNP